jgi:hypothetical protein
MIQDKGLRLFIEEHLKTKKMRRISSYECLNENECLLSLSNIAHKDRFVVSKVWYDPRGLRWFLVKFSDDLFFDN